MVFYLIFYKFFLFFKGCFKIILESLRKIFHFVLIAVRTLFLLLQNGLIPEPLSSVSAAGDFSVPGTSMKPHHLACSSQERQGVPFRVL